MTRDEIISCCPMTYRVVRYESGLVWIVYSRDGKRLAEFYDELLARTCVYLLNDAAGNEPGLVGSSPDEETHELEFGDWGDST